MNDEWFENAYAFHSKRAATLRKLQKGELMRRNGRFLLQDDLDAEEALMAQAKARTLRSVLVDLRNT